MTSIDCFRNDRSGLSCSAAISFQRSALFVVGLLSLTAVCAQVGTPGARPRSLAESWERANGIVIAQVLGCADGALPVNGVCPGSRHHFEAQEILKEASPRREFSGAYPRTPPSGFRSVCIRQDSSLRPALPCFDPRFELGASHLLFFDEEGEINWALSGNLNATDSEPRLMPSQSPLLQAYVRILRDYRDGRINDLAEPWIFSDDGSSCRLQQRILTRQLAFSYIYDDTQFNSQFRLAEISDGLQRWVSRAPVDTPSGDFVQELVTPEMQLGVVAFSVAFDRNLQTEANSARVAIGGQSWPLVTSNITVTMQGSAEAFVSIAQDLALGDAAQEIFDVLLSPVDLRITKRAIQLEQSGVSSIPPAELDHPVIETRSTQFAVPAEAFADCVDRNERMLTQ